MCILYIYIYIFISFYLYIYIYTYIKYVHAWTRSSVRSWVLGVGAFGWFWGGLRQIRHMGLSEN